MFSGQRIRNLMQVGLQQSHFIIKALASLQQTVENIKLGLANEAKNGAAQRSYSAAQKAYVLKQIAFIEYFINTLQSDVLVFFHNQRIPSNIDFGWIAYSIKTLQMRFLDIFTSKRFLVFDFFEPRIKKMLKKLSHEPIWNKVLTTYFFRPKLQLNSLRFSDKKYEVLSQNLLMLVDAKRDSCLRKVPSLTQNDLNYYLAELKKCIKSFNYSLFKSQAKVLASNKTGKKSSAERQLQLALMLHLKTQFLRKYQRFELKIEHPGLHQLAKVILDLLDSAPPLREVLEFLHPDALIHINELDLLPVLIVAKGNPEKSEQLDLAQDPTDNGLWPAENQVLASADDNEPSRHYEFVHKTKDKTIDMDAGEAYNKFLSLVSTSLQNAVEDFESRQFGPKQAAAASSGRFFSKPFNHGEGAKANEDALKDRPEAGQARAIRNR